MSFLFFSSSKCVRLPALPTFGQPQRGPFQEPLLRGGHLLDGGIRRLPAGRLALATLHGRHDRSGPHSAADTGKGNIFLYRLKRV